MKAVEQVLKIAEKHIEKMIENKRTRTEKAIAEGKYARFNERDEEIYRLKLTIPVMKSIRTYLNDEDTFENVKVKERTDIVQISGIINREGKKYRYETRIIIAGGYHIQCAHYRYITVSNLPKNNDNTQVEDLKNKIKKLNKMEKAEADIKTERKMIGYYQKELKEAEELINTPFERLMPILEEKCSYWSWNEGQNKETENERYEMAKNKLTAQISRSKSSIKKSEKRIMKLQEKMKSL